MYASPQPDQRTYVRMHLQGLFLRVGMDSGACTGPWGPGIASNGRVIAQRVMEAANASSLAELRRVDPSMLQWPHEDALDMEFPGTTTTMCHACAITVTDA